MPKMKVGFRDLVPSFRAQSLDPAPHGHGNGYPYLRDEIILGTTGANYPIVEAGGMIKVVQDIEVPLTNSGTSTDWTTGSYTGLTNVNYLPVFRYYDPADTSKKLNSRGNFYLYDAVIFSGTDFSGASGLSTAPTLTITLNAGNGGGVMWTWGPAALTGSPKILRADPATESSYGAVSNDRSVTEITLRIQASGSNLAACRFRLVMLGFEF